MKAYGLSQPSLWPGLETDWESWNLEEWICPAKVLSARVCSHLESTSAKTSVCSIHGVMTELEAGEWEVNLLSPGTVTPQFWFGQPPRQNSKWGEPHKSTACGPGSESPPTQLLIFAEAIQSDHEKNKIGMYLLLFLLSAITRRWWL
jgi:hypothetical protein